MITGGHEHSQRLRELARELIETAEAIERSEQSVFRFRRTRPTDSATMLSPQLARQASAEYHSRRDREPDLPGALLGEPVWDILLDLYIQRAKGRLTSITSSCLASGAPSTTALRHLKLLEEHSLVEFVPHQGDNRVRLVDFTKRGYNIMSSYLQRRVKTAPSYADVR